MTERIDAVTTTFFEGPAEFLVAKVAASIAAVPQFQAIFGPRIDAYRRMDYSIRDTPALRVYNEIYTKEFESWFIYGEVLIDVIFPAALRRHLLQQYQDTLTSALCQQFRRPAIFNQLCIDVPGLNELGKQFSANKSLGFQIENELVPLTQIRVNFRIDLRIWDNNLTANDLTKDEPFVATLGNLESIYTLITGMDDDDMPNVNVELLQDTI